MEGAGGLQTCVLCVWDFSGWHLDRGGLYKCWTCHECVHGSRACRDSVVEQFGSVRQLLLPSLLNLLILFLSFSVASPILDLMGLWDLYLNTHRVSLLR
jgi:hypothetical protein